jgi:hypothetical protein
MSRPHIRSGHQNQMNQGLANNEVAGKFGERVVDLVVAQRKPGAPPSNRP